MVKKSMVTGMDIVGSASCKALGTCTPCIKGKQSHEDVPKMTNMRATEPLGRLFSDVCGPMQTQSCQGFNYFMSWIDDYSCKATVDGIWHKSNVLEHLKAFVAAAELESGHKLKVLRSDSRGKYVSCEVRQFLLDKGIRHETTTADSLEFNGVSEHFNRTVMEMAHSMLEDSGLSKSFWFDAIEYATYIHNIIPTCSLTTNVMPHEAWTGNKPDVSLICTFGCHAFIHIPDSRCRKLDPKSLICTFIGYAKHRKAYHLMHHPTGHIIESQDVIFKETPDHEHLEHVQIEVDPESDMSGGEEIAAPVAPESADSEAEVTKLLDADKHPAIFHMVLPAAPQL
ncbi:hypothetical protein EWM64_g181 [Hericium alpestre]|uniref:Integrase catalytic domain-containing protein n=1 Tax=Hericium alpestre TaxID=135208 RepID=A0A4Z0AAN6_9AGAM|nr:hypothetical protein EWM64_g181 [Hericium alpestre]